MKIFNFSEPNKGTNILQTSTLIEYKCWLFECKIVFNRLTIDLTGDSQSKYEFWNTVYLMKAHINLNISRRYTHLYTFLWFHLLKYQDWWFSFSQVVRSRFEKLYTHRWGLKLRIFRLEHLMNRFCVLKCWRLSNLAL